MITIEQLAQRITNLTRERDEFVMNANRQEAAYNGAIQILEQLINELMAEQPTAESQPGPKEFRES